MIDNKSINNTGLEHNTSEGEEIANFVSHTVGAGLSVIAFILLTIRASWTRELAAIVSFMIFGIGLIVLYTMSSIYHGLKSGTAKRIFEIFDHSAIYILIAATYTPFLVLVVKSKTGIMILWAQWIICILGILFKSFFTGKMKMFSTLLYLFMGWMIVFAFKELKDNINSVSLMFLISGGILYSLGTIFYTWKICKFNHMIWHIFVIFGSVSHFFAVWFLV
ncbi:hemolysin III family protein [Leptotrichia sp. OH3620_COT-345]|uniref:PAQR family membrane homeostasis protein TrhA n=1 Tax=Leptotrichia sp. OH3620_COT-345 TaxID=2491048 RepID=UPI000F653395|nr:hemolysin III family protein [Leptotrichia sp. OH3620_COT-345]RRD40424.1 hemolysin III family protein [Leptotrichia sp. OH3620_COT-345]